MQQVQRREQTDRITWARAMIFAVGFFFIAALLMGQLPGFIYNEMTASSLVGLELGTLALGLVCLAGFVVIQVVVWLFDPKPVIPPIVFGVLGAGLTVAGVVVIFAAVLTQSQYFPQGSFTWNPVLGGKFLWFPDGSIDFTMIGATMLGVGVALVFFSVLAMREQRNPDRRDPGTTPAIRTMITVGIAMIIVFLIYYTFVSDTGLATLIDPQCPVAIDPAKGCPGPITGLFIVRTILNIYLVIAILLTLGAFALRLHYLMRPVRGRTMSALYMVGVNLMPFGVIFLLVWLFIYPLMAWMHTWSFIGLGDYLTICARKSAVPQSCAFSPQAGYIVDTLITGAFFTLLMGSIIAWKVRRNLVVIGGVTITAVLSLATLLVHTNPDEIIIAALLCAGGLVLAVIWTSVARREFAIVGEKNLGCLGQWLVVGTCLFIYIAAFAFFSMPVFPNETETNIPFNPGLAIYSGGKGSADAIVTFFVIGILAAVQFYFLTRNRYKV